MYICESMNVETTPRTTIILLERYYRKNIFIRLLHNAEKLCNLQYRINAT